MESSHLKEIEFYKVIEVVNQGESIIRLLTKT